MRDSTDELALPATAFWLATGLLKPECSGLPDSGLMTMGDVWLMGDKSSASTAPSNVALVPPPACTC